MKKIKLEFGKEMKAFIGVSDADGSNYTERPMHSFTRNFLEYFAYATSYSDKRKILDYRGRPISVSDIPNFSMVHHKDDPFQLIIIGTGGPIRSAEMTAMGNPLKAGMVDVVGPGISSVVTQTEDEYKVIFEKSFKNTSGSPQQISEIGLSYVLDNVDGYVLFSHDKLDPEIMLNAGETKRFYISFGFPKALNPNYPILVERLFACDSGTRNCVSINDSDVTVRIGGDKYPHLFEIGGLNHYADHSVSSLIVGKGDSPSYAVIPTDGLVGLADSPYTSVHQDGKVTYFDVVRIMKNTSDTPVSVLESGLLLGFKNESLMFAHKVVDPPIAVEPDEIVEFSLRIQTTFGEEEG